MLALNHGVAGAVIAVSLKQPALFVPAAVASHFVLDVLPHFGNAESFGRMSRRYYRVITVDAILSGLTAAAMIHAWPSMAGHIFLGAFAAVLPDLFWPLAMDTKEGSWARKFFNFHKGIQTSETKRGIVYEIGYFAIFMGVFITLYYEQFIQ